MERQSPPTERVTRLLDLLVAHPGERFTVSEIARRADISKPTCIGIARALARAGYLDRDPRTQTYALGPALITAGRAALESLGPLELVRTEMQRASDDLNLACTASAILDEHLTIIERTGPPCPYDPLIGIGTRLPLVPPTGKIAVIWHGDDQLARWLDKRPRSGPDLDTTRFRELADATRQQGYLVEPLGEAGRRLLDLLDRLAGKELSDDAVAVVAQVGSTFDEDDYFPSEVRPRRRHAVSTISAPVYDINGSVDLVLVVYVARDDVPYKEVQHYGERVREAAAVVMEAIGGHDPWEVGRVGAER